MITCKLGSKEYYIDYVSGRALREIDDAADMHQRLVAIAKKEASKQTSEDKLTVKEALDSMVKWFCILFNNQFTPDEVYDNYPADRLVNDMALSILAVQNSVTSILSSFPTTPTAPENQA